MEILDVSDPANPTHVGAIFDDSTTELYGASDIYVSGKYAYVSAYRDNGVEILEKEHLPSLADRCVALAHDPEQHAKRSRLVREYALTMGPETIIPRFVDFHRQYLR